MLARMLGGSSGSAKWIAAWRPAARAVPAQPTISLWSASGSSAKTAVDLAFSFSWHLKRRATAESGP